MRKDEYSNMYRHQKTFWWYRGMAEINTALLYEFAPKKSSKKILDAGCGTGAAFIYLKQFGDVTGVDVSDYALRLARRLGSVRKGDIIKLPFQKNTFDIVVCLDVLYHRWVGDYRKALSEFYRVLKPGGIVLIREPAYNWLRGEHDKVDFTQHRFSKRELHKELSTVGFRVQKLTSANFFLFPIVLVKRIIQMNAPDKKPESDIKAMSPIVESLLFQVLKLEGVIMKFFSLPWGSSILCIAKKEDTQNTHQAD